MNTNVDVIIHHGEINEAFVSEFNAVVFTDFYSREKLITWNKVCRGKGIPFIFAGLLGLYGFCFLDFGDEHKIMDPDGFPPQ
jgi:ubiquitin-activating enzyme E1